jgi:hypothetical protein
VYKNVEKGKPGGKEKEKERRKEEKDGKNIASRISFNALTRPTE